MNANFVCIRSIAKSVLTWIKVHDRGSSANWKWWWPLNALALADGKPFFAGTYFPKENWLEMLHYFVDVENKTLRH
jgi:uncharacterized protein YyaL (SSP411 family)